MNAKTMPSKFNSTDKFSGKQIAEGSTIVEMCIRDRTWGAGAVKMQARLTNRRQ